MAYEYYFMKCKIPTKIQEKVNKIMSGYYPKKEKWFDPDIFPLYQKTFIQTSYEYLNGANVNGKLDSISIRKPAVNDFNLKTNIVIYYARAYNKQTLMEFCQRWDIEPLTIGWEPSDVTIKFYIDSFKEHSQLKSHQRFSQRILNNWNNLLSLYAPDDQQELILYKMFGQAVIQRKTLSSRKLTEYLAVPFRKYCYDNFLKI